MFPDNLPNMMNLFYHTALFYINLCIVCVLALFYVIICTSLCMTKFALDYVNSVEHPFFVALRRFVKMYLRMMFWNKTYRRFRYNEEATERGDSYIDKILKDMENNLDEYDPYYIEDSVVGFHKKVMFVNVSGEAKLHDGYINGLSTLHRTKHCSLEDEGNKLRVRADLGAGQLHFNYRGSVKFMSIGPTITVTGTLSYLEVFLEFKVNKETGREGRLTKFVIDDMRGMQVRVSGLGPLNWAVNPIISGVTKIFKRFVRNYMENKVEKHMRERIPEYKFPVEGGEVTVATESISTDTDESLLPETEPTPETDAPEPTPEDLEENPEAEPDLNRDVNDVYYPETPDSSFISDDELENASESEISD